MFPAVTVLEGRFPQQDDEAMLNEAVKSRLGLQVGDLVSLTVPRERADSTGSPASRKI